MTEETIDNERMLRALNRMSDETKRMLLEGRFVTEEKTHVEVLIQMSASLQAVNGESIIAENDPLRLARDRAIGYIARAIRCLKAADMARMQAGSQTPTI